MITKIKKDVSLDDYNPFEHREVAKPNSDIRSLANLLKSSLGSGLLAMPLAFSNAGWALGIVGTVIIAFICGHCVHIFVETSRGCCQVERKPMLSYSETCHSAFYNGPKIFRTYANFAKIFAEFALCFTYVGVCCIFTVLIATSIKQLFDTYVSTFILPVEYYCLILLVPLCLMVQIRHLKWLAPFSLLANILLFATFAICLYYIFGKEINISDKNPVGHWSRFPAFLSPAICAKVFISVSIILTYPLHFFVVIDIFTRYTKPHTRPEYHNITQVAARTFIVCVCGAVGIALPYLEKIIDLVGALFYSTLGLIIPGIIETVFRWDNLGKYNWILYKNILVVLFGMLSLVSGSAVTIMDIIEIVQKKP